MKGGGAFHRSQAMLAAVTAIMASTLGDTAKHLALSGLTPYVSHGHGRGFRYAAGNGQARVQRAAAKSRNRQRNRKAHRGARS